MFLAIRCVGNVQGCGIDFGMSRIRRKHGKFYTRRKEGEKNGFKRYRIERQRIYDGEGEKNGVEAVGEVFKKWDDREGFFKKVI